MAARRGRGRASGGRASARLGAGAAGVAVALVLGAAPAHAVPQNDYQMPFPCGQSWTGTTRASHSPSSNSVDWNRPDDLGDDVVAAAPGKVEVAEPRGTSGYGHWVRIKHADGETTLYAHLDEVAVVVGQTVDQGALVGTVGVTGNTSGPHLHFEERNSSGSVMFPWFDGVAFDFGSTQKSDNCVDVPLAGNFLKGDRAEVAVFRRSAASTFTIRRADGETRVIPFGGATDQPVVGDWDGDGRVNPGVRTPGTKTFHLLTPAGVTDVALGRVSDLPVAGDWDGDGTWEVGVRRGETSSFRLRSATGSFTTIPLGNADDLPVTGDWDGDGRTDVGVYDVRTATWTLRITDQDGLVWTAQIVFGTSGDLPVTGDWDANGRTDLGVWDPDTAQFAQRQAAAPTTTRVREVTSIAFGRAR